MKKKFFLIVCGLCLLTGIAAAQLPGIVYLKNGSVLRGTIIPGKDGSVMIHTDKGRLYIFNIGDIRNISLRTNRSGVSRSGVDKFAEFEKGREIELGFGYGQPYSKNGSSVVSIALLSYNFRLSPHFSIGGRWDFDYIRKAERWYAPLILNMKGYLGRSTHSQPFLSLDAGYALGFRHDEGEYGPSPHGWLLTPSVGMAVRLGERTGIHCYIGYRMQWIPEYVLTGTESEMPIQTGAIMFRAAFTIYNLR